jgi:hypothetical protein
MGTVPATARNGDSPQMGTVPATAVGNGDSPEAGTVPGNGQGMADGAGQQALRGMNRSPFDKLRTGKPSGG